MGVFHFPLQRHVVLIHHPYIMLGMSLTTMEIIYHMHDHIPGHGQVLALSY